MGDVDIVDLMWTSVKAILPVFLLLGLGAFFVHKRILDAKAAAALSWLSKWLYSPSLVFVRLGQGFSRELFSEVGVLMLMGVIILSFNFIISSLLVPVAKPTRSFRKWFVYSMTFSNITALPLVFITAVCTGGKIRRPAREIEALSLVDSDQYYESAECIETGELYLVIYIALPYVLVFMTAVLLKSTGSSAQTPAAAAAAAADKKSPHDLEASPQAAPDASSTSPRSSVDVFSADPVVELALPAPESVAQEAQVQEHQQGQVLADPVSNRNIVCSTSSNSASTGPSPTRSAPSAEPTRAGAEAAEPSSDEDETAAPSCLRRWSRIAYEVIMQPAVLSQIFGLIVGLNPKLQSFVFNTNSVAAPFVSVLKTLAPGLVSVVTLALALLVGDKLTKTKYSELLGGDEERMGISRRTLFVFVFGRMFIIPGLSFMLLYVAIDLFPKDQMLLMILFFEVFVPTANMCAICAPPDQGQIISLGMINQYLVGIFSMTMWCFIALSITTEATASL